MLPIVLVAWAAFAAVASPAQAQLSSDRRGLWLGLGLGPGSAKSTCSICEGQETALAAHARVGGTLSPSFLGGVEGTGWLTHLAQGDRSFLMFAAVSTFYPSRSLGLHVKAGLGQYWYFEEDAVRELATQGMALQLGAGFDLRIISGLSVTPFATLVKSGFGNPTRLDKATGIKLPLLSDMTVQFLQLGLAATLH